MMVTFQTMMVVLMHAQLSQASNAMVHHLKVLTAAMKYVGMPKTMVILHAMMGIC
jgi:hypothetical protein